MKKRKIQASSFAPIADDHILEVRNLKVDIAVDDYILNAVRGVSFSLKKGETLGLVGESGCGKSVTSKEILGINPSNCRSEGEILYRTKSGKVVNLLTLERNGAEFRAIRGAEISMIFQEPMTAFSPLYTIGNQLSEIILLHDPHATRADARRQVLDMLKKVGIANPEKRIDQYPHEFSGGMRQRAMIAMALICEPKLLIADEPTTALDVTIQAQILELMKDLQKKENTSIIFITHNLGVVAEICDRVSVMYAGRIVEQGLVQDIFYRPQHPYTKGLIASTPRLDKEDQERLVPIEGTPIDLLNPPSGCNFGPRCKNCMKICLREKPPYAQVGEGHISACWLHFMNHGSGEAAGTGKENTANE